MTIISNNNADDNGHPQGSVVCRACDSEDHRNPVALLRATRSRKGRLMPHVPDGDDIRAVSLMYRPTPLFTCPECGGNTYVVHSGTVSCAGARMVYSDELRAWAPVGCTFCVKEKDAWRHTNFRSADACKSVLGWG